MAESVKTESLNSKSGVQKVKKRKFSSFKYKDALKYLQLENLLDWTIEAVPSPPSDFFQQRLRRLEQCFDLQSYEKSKELLIDAFCEEAILSYANLKIWKGAAIESDELIGEADYLVTQRRAYLEAPLLCVVEAKKDDFEQGAAQCLVEMMACRWNNLQLPNSPQSPIEIYGVVTNGEGWKFYCFTADSQVQVTKLYAFQDADRVLGVLQYLFDRCQKNLIGC